MNEKFVHLRARTSYSLSEGAIKVDDLVDLCVKNKLPAVAVTDFGNLFCAMEFSMEAVSKGVKPIIGCTLLFDPGFSTIERKFDQIVLLAKNNEGYKNLIKIVSNSFLKYSDQNFSYITIDDLREYSNGLIVLTGGFEGTFGRLILEDQNKEAEKFLLELKKIFHDNLYIELIRRKILEEEKKESYLLEIAYKHNIPLVATNNVFFSSPDMYEAHDVLLCIADGKYLVEDERRKSNKESYFKSASQMCELFSDVPEAIENTLLIAKRCSFIVEEHAPMLPRIDKNEKQLLIQQAQQGLEERIRNEENKDQYYKRLKYELDVITEMNFSGYFLIVSDFIKWSKNNGIPVGPGRGSGAGSLVAWSLSITDLDPIKFGLIFERFLNPERISMPDFDIDFCQERRDEVIRYVQGKYGGDRVAQIITFGKLQAKAVIRDVGRTLQMPYGQVDKISKMVPFNAINPVTLSQAIDMEPMLQKARDSDDQVAKLLSIALKLEGLHRHTSTHAAGIVIAEKDLTEIVALYKDPKSDMSVVQYSMKYAEMAGLVKFDFLGLKTLTVISKTCNIIAKNNKDFKIESIPLDDAKTYELLSLGNSTGIFQFESAGMRDALRKLKPDHIKDLMALGALYRPGPMDNIPLYIACKHNKQQPDYMHPLLKEVLEETFGVIIYQEQVLQVAQKLAGYSLGAADLLRRAMGKKIKAEMDAQRKMFIDGALQNKIDQDQASKIFDQVAKFAGYGFNRAHAAAYAIISYQTAYLKSNYPLEFLTACLNMEFSDTDKLNLFCGDAKYQNINILPPDINLSEELFIIEGDSIRYGLAALKNVGIAAIEQLVSERKNNGPFKDIFDLCERLDSKVINKRQLESLIKSGAFDKLHANRRQLHDFVEIFINYNSLVKKEKDTNQISLFGSKVEHHNKPIMNDVEDWGDSERIKFEFESFGFYLTDHPLDNYHELLKNSNIKNSEYLKTELNDGFSSIWIAGVPLQVKTRMSQKGRFVSVLLSDRHGSFEVSIFDDNLLNEANDLVNSNTPLFIIADARKDEGGVRLTATKIRKLDDYLNDAFKAVKIWINEIETVEMVKKIFEEFNSGNTKLYLSVVIDDKHEVELELPKLYQIDLSKIKRLNLINGVKHIEFA